jgi:hypothetical protein
MALNLWKIGGKPTSFNPLPSGWGNFVNVGIGEFIVTFKAKSLSSTSLQFGVGGEYIFQSLNTEFKSFQYVVKRPTNFYFYDVSSKGDIIIEDIQLVQKPLPKLTINGIDGFLSGKWNLHANARVVDDETLELNATGSSQETNLVIDVNGNQSYSFNVLGSGYYFIQSLDANNSLINTIVTKTATGITSSFTTQSNCKKLRIVFYNSSDGVGIFTFKRPMLNLGTTPAPYERKKGERMVLPVVKGNLFNANALRSSGYGVHVFADNILTITGVYYTAFVIDVKPNTNYFLSGSASGTTIHSNINVWGDSGGSAVIKSHILNTSFNSGSYNKIYLAFYSGNANSGTSVFENIMLNEGTTPQPYTPYAVQVNKKPKRYVPKKNLFDGMLELGFYDGTNGTKQTHTLYMRSVNKCGVKPNTTYILGNDKGYTQWLKYEYDVNGNFLRQNTDITQLFTTGSNTYHVTFRTYSAGANDLTTKVQLEEGTTATQFEPYTLTLPRAKSGLQFDGVKDYLQLPSMTMDSIEFDCLLETDGTKVFVDGRTGSDFWVSGSGLSKGTNVLESTPFINNQRQKIVVKAKTAFTDDVIVFANNVGTLRMKGTLYKVTCYLNGNVVAHYDFENPQNIVGDKVLERAKNLIPSFEDARWQLHANADVLGKDVLRLEVSAGWQQSNIVIPVTNGKNYFLIADSGPTYFYKGNLTAVYGGEVNTLGFNNKSRTVNVDESYNGFINIRLQSSTTGTFDFIKPALYELTGREAVLMGKPTPLRKASKRSLYSKR